MSKIIVLGSCSIDYTTYAYKLPRPGETIHGYKFQTSYGGKGANQCVAAAKLSGNTVMIARVGDDVWGKKYIENMRINGIDVTHMHLTKDCQTGIAQITVSATGENQIVIVEGANKLLSEEDVENAKELITNGSILICQLETPVDTTIRAFQLCSGIKILNAAPAKYNLSKELLSLTTILCINESEASILTSKPVETIKEAMLAIKDLLQFGCENIIITLGSNGVVFASQKDKFPVHIPSMKVNAIDTTGAGDAFIGTLAITLATDPNISLKTAIGVASYAASMSVVREGTQESFLNIPYSNLITNYKTDYLAYL